MSFTPDTDNAWQAYVFARNLIKGADLAVWDATFSQYFCFQVTSAATLVANSGSPAASNPNGSIATAIAAANLAVKQLSRNF